jgi:hypothetical protein
MEAHPHLPEGGNQPAAARGKDRVWVVVALAGLFSVQAASYAAHRIEAAQTGLTRDEVRLLAPYVRGRVVQPSLGETGEAGVRTLRVPLPDAWAAHRTDRNLLDQLALFVDGRRTPIAMGAPEDTTVLPRAFMRSRRAAALVLECPPSPGCADVLLARQDRIFGLATQILRLTRSPVAAAAVMVAVCLFAWGLATFVALPLAPLVPAALVIGSVWFYVRLYATPWAPAVLTAEVMLAVGTRILIPRSGETKPENSPKEAAAHPVCPWLTTMLIALLVVNLEAFSTRIGVVWDARDEAWFFLRFFGSALRDGRFGDFLPNIGSGYPVAANVVAGAYNPLYNAFALAFPTSISSANLLYLALQALTLIVTFLLGRTLQLGLPAASFLALSMVGSGFFVGHASHFSYLSAGVGLLAVLLGLRLAAAGAWRSAAVALAAATWHLGTAGSPEHLVFGGQVLLVVWVFHLARSSAPRRFLIATVGGVAIGALLALPALVHFVHQLGQSVRAQGLTVTQVLEGSLRPSSLWNLVNPFMRRLASPEPRLDT